MHIRVNEKMHDMQITRCASAADGTGLSDDSGGVEPAGWPAQNIVRPPGGAKLPTSLPLMLSNSRTESVGLLPSKW